MANGLLALGSNLGDRHQQLQEAVKCLGEQPGIELLAVSRFRETDAVGGPDGQAAFLNGAALLQTSLSPRQLLSVTQAVEALLGRTREVHWGPRVIDIDLLTYDDRVCRTESLVLPHPWMVARRFVVEPAAEIAPQLVHPELGWTLERLERHLRETPNRLVVEGIAGLNLGPRIGPRAGATFLSDPGWPQRGRPASIPEGLQAIELAERRCQFLSASPWCQGNPRVISECWFAALAVHARRMLTGGELARFEDRLGRLVATLPAPKLLIFCRTAESTASTHLPEQWLDGCEYVRQQDQYPWLEIPVVAEDRTIDQITAAFQSMQ